MIDERDREGSAGHDTNDIDKIKLWHSVYTQQDKAAYEAAKAYVPNVEEIETKAIGVIVRYNQKEFPSRFTDKISVKSLGKPPGYYIFGNSFMYGRTIHIPDVLLENQTGYADQATPSIIEAHTISGNTIEIYVGRHKTDIVFAAIIDAWRRNR